MLAPGWHVRKHHPRSWCRIIKFPLCVNPLVWYAIIKQPPVWQLGLLLFHPYASTPTFWIAFQQHQRLWVLSWTYDLFNTLKNHFRFLCTNSISHHSSATRMFVCMFVALTNLHGKTLEQLIPLPRLLILFLSPTLSLLANLAFPARFAFSQWNSHVSTFECHFITFPKQPFCIPKLTLVWWEV